MYKITKEKIQEVFHNFVENINFFDSCLFYFLFYYFIIFLLFY